MNHIYRLVWSHVNQAWIAVAETAKGHGKSISARKLIAAAAALAGASLLASSAYAADAGNATVVGGAGSVSQSGATTTINQTSQRLAIEWTSLNTAANEALVFNQPNASAIALNRISGSSPSTLLGSLTANGQVYILNPNGVLFGAGAQVNVGGLVASTLNMNAADFMNGSSTFTKDAGSSGSVVNQGQLTAANGGYIALLSGTVRNEGTINAPSGTALLAAGDKVTLNINNGSLLGYTIDQGDLNALIENKQLIRADGGQVILAARALDKLSAAVINNTGVIEARTVQNQNGKILLIGDMDVGTANVGGTLDASAPTTGDGGFIETSAAHVKVADGTLVTTAAAQGLTGSWLIDPTDFTIASGSGAQTSSGIGATTLANNLANTSITLTTDNSTGTESGDINVNAAVSWGANTTLTLNAFNDININAAITATGDSAGLVLNHGNYATAGSATSGTDYNVKAPITLSGANASLVINGVTYRLIHSMADLLAINSNGLNGHYALAGDLDAGGTPYTDALVGTSFSSSFGGTFAGLRHTISNLSINSGGNYGSLFATTGNSGVIRDIGMVNVSISGHAGVGGLVGANQGSISNSYVTGTVTAIGTAGGLAAFSNGTISNSYATVNVSAGGNVGGLVGSIIDNNFIETSISNSYATGNVTGTGFNSNVGGLVGSILGGVFSNTYASGSVTGSGNVGGLVGIFSGGGSINNSYASGRVTGSGMLGGLTGQTQDGVATASFWNMTTSGISVGDGSDNSFGTVVGIDDTAARNAATFASVGWNIDAAGGTGTIWRIYEGQSGPLLRSFLKPITVTGNTTKTYDGTASGVSTYTKDIDGAVLSGDLNYVAGKNVGTYSTANGTLSQSGLYSNQQGYDISYADASLTINKADLTVTAGTVTKTYDGTTSATGTGSIGVLAGAAAGDVINSSGSEVFADKNAGANKTVIASGVTVRDSSNADATGNYNIIYVDNTTGIINQANLTVTATPVTKTYDGTTSTTGVSTIGTLAGVAAGDAINSTGIESFADKNAGTGKTVVASGVTIKDAGNADVSSNYNITYVDNTASIINKADLTVTASTVTKTYDGTTGATGTGTVGALAGAAAGDAVNSAGSEAFTDKNAGSNKTVIASGVTIKDSGNADVSSNYNITYVDNTASIVNKADLIVTANGIDKVYDGLTSASLTYTDDRIAGDVLNVTGAASFADKNAGTAKTVTIANVSASGTDAGNYNLILTSGTASASITPAALTVTANSSSKYYDGKAYIGNNGATVSGLVGGDTLADLMGTLNYGGSAQGATGIGSYGISPGGLSSGNYVISFVNGILTIKALSQTSAALGGFALESNYDGAQQALAATPSQFDMQYAGLGQRKRPQPDLNPAPDAVPVNGVVQLTPRLRWVQ